MKWLKTALLAATGTGIVLAAPIVPQEMQWLGSYETAAFETTDGDLGMDEYAVASEGEWYVRTISKNEGQFIATTSPEAIKGKTQVAIRCTGCAHYSEFASADGTIVREPFEGDYHSLTTVKDTPQPMRRELRSVLAGQDGNAAIAHTANSSSTGCAACTSFSWSHTISGSDTLLVAAIGFQGDETVSSVTFNGNALSLANNRSQGSAESWIYFQLSPDAGTHTIAVTNSEGNGAGGGISFSGVDQSDVDLDATASNANGGGGTNSVTITTVADNAWIADIVSCSGDDAFAPVVGQTERFDINHSGGGIAGSTLGPKSPAGSQLMSWGADCGNQWAMSAVSFAPAGAVTEQTYGTLID